MTASRPASPIQPPHGNDTRRKGREQLDWRFRRLQLRIEAGLLLTLILTVFAYASLFLLHHHRSHRNLEHLHRRASVSEMSHRLDLFLMRCLAEGASLSASQGSSAHSAHYSDDLEVFPEPNPFRKKPRGQSHRKESPLPLLLSSPVESLQWGFSDDGTALLLAGRRSDDAPFLLEYDFAAFAEESWGETAPQGAVLDILDRERREIWSGAPSASPRTDDLREAMSDPLSAAPWVVRLSSPENTLLQSLSPWLLFVLVFSMVLLSGCVIVVHRATRRLLRRARHTAEIRWDLQAQLLHAAKMATVGELAAGIAHEINNPLAIVSATSQTLRDSFDPRFRIAWTPEDIRKELDVIDGAVARARLITRKLLDFSRKTQPNWVACDLHRILEEVLGGLKEQEWSLSNIRLIRSFAPQPLYANGDPDQLSQVFLNLVNNAGDAIHGGGEIRVATRPQGGTIRISISDSGAGIAPDLLDKIFHPFFTTKEPGRGTGLGLSISLNIVESMGGTIEVESVEGEGSTFTVVLPVHGIKEA